LNDAKWVAVTSDMWSSDAKVNYITITAHYTDEQFVAHNRVLETLDFVGEHNADNIRERIKDTLVHWDVLSSTVCVVTDNTNTMLKVGRELGLGWCGCFSHLLQTVVKVGIDEPDIAPQLSNVEKTVSHIRRSHKSRDDLHAAQNQLLLPSRDLVQDVETRWNSSFYMLQRFVDEEQPLSLLFVNQDFLRRLRDTSIVTGMFINPKIKMNFHHKERENGLYSGFFSTIGIDFQVLKLLLKLLEPLEDVTREVSSATTATLSLVLPFLVAILTLIEPDSSVLDKMKTFMKTQLEKWFNKSFSNKFYLLACIVDPRFKHFTFTDLNNFSTNGITASTLTDWKSVGARKIAEQLLKDEYHTISTTIL
ncbi:unnamed protein product, partial [Didymodactylos carnosus]